MWEILKTHGIGPAPRRTGPTWPQFLRCQAEAILACDCFTVDLLDGTQAHVLAVIEHATRRNRILGVTLHPTGHWTTQQARNLLKDLGDQAHRVKFMIRDRGSNFTAAFERCPRRRRHPDRAVQRPDAPHERHRRTLDRGRWLLGHRRYVVPITIESGPTRCSTQALLKPASCIQPMQSAAV